MISAALGDMGFYRNKVLSRLFRVRFVKLKPFLKKIFLYSAAAYGNQSEDLGSRKGEDGESPRWSLPHNYSVHRSLLAVKR